MFESDHRNYYAKRAAHATELGCQAIDPKIATIHHELALRYSLLSVHGSQARPEVVALGKGRRSDPPDRATARSGGSLEPEPRQALKHA